MSAKVTQDGGVTLEGDIVQYAEKLFNEKEYYGAFSRILSLIQCWMQILSDEHFKRTYDSFENYRQSERKFSYSVLIADLGNATLISDAEKRRLKDFSDSWSRMRNRLVRHAYLKHPWDLVNKKELALLLQEGKDLVDLVARKCNYRVTQTTIGGRRTSDSTIREKGI